MIFHNKVKHNMYIFLKSYNKYHNYDKVKQLMIEKIDENDFNFAVSQCIDNHFINGIRYTSEKTTNYIHINHSEILYITYYGFEFLKNYYGNIKNLIRDIFLILITAIITVIINNKWSNLDECNNIVNNIISQNVER